MKNITEPVQNYLLDGGIPVYASVIRDIILSSQAKKEPYRTPYLLKGIQQTFKHFMKKGYVLFAISADVYSPNNTSVLHIDKCFPRFAQAHMVLRNGINTKDVNIPEDITYAELLDKSNHEVIKAFNPKEDSSLKTARILNY